MFTSLPGFPQSIDNMIQEVPSQLPGQFPFLLDMNAGRPLGLGNDLFLLSLKMIRS